MIFAAMFRLGAAHAEPVAAEGAAAAVPGDAESVVVAGKRASLATAQEIKRDKIEIVDSVVADDINKLPDINLAEALQRVTGIQITRDRGEGSTVAIRGLTQVETLLNGREVFTAGFGRNLDFADFPSEMIASINVYKTSSAEHIEGGIGGMIDLRTHRPFDFAGREIVASGRLIHGDLVDDTKPQFSLLASDRWETGNGGEFGALVNIAYQERAWREDQKSTGAPVARTNIFAGQTVFAPSSTSETTSVGERERIAGNIVLQWRPTETLDLYAEASHARLKTIQDSYQINVTGGGTFAAGSATLFPGTNDMQGITWTNAPVSILSFARDTVDRTTQVAVGGSWTGKALTLKSDLSYTRSYNNLYLAGVTLGSTAASFTHNLEGSVPRTGIGGTNLLDPASLSSAGLLYAFRPFEGELTALQFDGEYQLFGDFLDMLAAGVRYAKREAGNAPGQISANPAGSLAAASAAGLLVANPYSDFFPGETSIGNFMVGDLSLARHFSALYNALGVTAAVAASNPLGTWNVNEETQSGYLMARLKAASLPFDGNVGLRVIRTQEAVSGFQSVPSSGALAPIHIDSTYTDYLPSANLRYELRQGLYLRGAASKTLTRPDFNQISPSLTLNPVQLIGSAGNPDLKPVRADNLDLALEKYISATTSVYLTGFWKKVDGFVTTMSNPETYDGITYQVSRPQNSSAADIRGIEVGYQQFYDFLPGWLSGLGLQANYTYIDSETRNSLLNRDIPLQNVSRHSYNLIGMYEKGKLSARVAYNWRDKFLNSIANTGAGVLPVYTKAYGWLDASVGYRFTDRISLSIEGTNLLRTVRTSYYGEETRPQSAWINDAQVSAVMTVRF